ncbi:hypothetical protein MKX01_031006 [Papaver californicum]|nr:hypothetical protein MKX01_031006 [Papaver californicum]
MASQLNCNLQRVSSSATQAKFKSLRSLEKGNSSSVTVHVTRKWEDVDMVIVDEEVYSISYCFY